MTDDLLEEEAQEIVVDVDQVAVREGDDRQVPGREVRDHAVRRGTAVVVVDAGTVLVGRTVVADPCAPLLDEHAASATTAAAARPTRAPTTGMGVPEPSCAKVMA